MSGTRTQVFAWPKSGTAPSGSVRAAIVFSLTAIASRGLILSRHIATLAQEGWFVTGSRLLLSRELTARILTNGLVPERWGLTQWIVQRMRGRVNRVGPLVLSRSALVGYRRTRRWRGARGSNMAFWRRDLDAVDGFDAAFTGWGREDLDIFVRMIRHGVRRRDGRLGATVLHLWHPDADRSRLTANQSQLDQLLAAKRVRAQQGLSWLAEPIEQRRQAPAHQ